MSALGSPGLQAQKGLTESSKTRGKLMALKTATLLCRASVVLGDQ